MGVRCSPATFCTTAEDNGCPAVNVIIWRTAAVVGVVAAPDEEVVVRIVSDVLVTCRGLGVEGGAWLVERGRVSIVVTMVDAALPVVVATVDAALLVRAAVVVTMVDAALLGRAAVVVTMVDAALLGRVAVVATMVDASNQSN